MQTNPGIIEEYLQLNKTITNEKDQMEKKLQEYAEVNTIGKKILRPAEYYSARNKKCH